MPISAGMHLGPYEIVAPIGAGGMGEVFRANDPRLHRDVAIKVSAEQFSERAEREARAVAALNHPNICHIYDVGRNYLVMELVEGPTLAEHIASGAIPLEEALGIARQIADALEAAHEKGIVHRDLKPANVKIKPDGMVKVLDFGLAKVMEDSSPLPKPESSPTLTLEQAGLLLGTAAYMPPEQARGKPVDKRADIWAFGVILYEMLTGRRLFPGETISDTLAAVLKEEPEWNRVPVKVQRLLRRCLDKDPKRRLRDIGDAWLLLEEETPSQSAAAPQHRSWPAWALAGLLAVAALALAFVHFREKPPVAEPVRFLIPPPEKSSFRTLPSLSPDGRRIAFSATGPDGRTLLWVRALDSPEAQPLAGTDEARYSFWSPDSRFVAFGAAGKLKKVEASGGPPQNLCDAPDPVLGGAWNREGVIIFGGAAGSPISRVSSTGGLSSAVTMIDRSRNETLHGYPSFLPDGRHFIYLRVGGSRESIGAYVGSLDVKPEDQDSKRLLEVRFGAEYASASDGGIGYLLFVREDTLMAQSFDPARLKLSGEPVRVAEPVLTYRTSAWFSASSNGVLAYRSGGAGSTPLVWFDRQGNAVGSFGEPAEYNDIALSPDGTRVAVARRDRQARELNIWRLDLSRGGSMRLTFHSGRDGVPVWSPDGSRIAFASNIGSLFTLYQKPSNGAGNEESLVQSNEPIFPNDWSRDGRFLLYSSVDSKTKSDLWVLQDPGGHLHDRKPTPYLRTEFNESQGQFSPDTRWVAYTSDESGPQEIYVQPFPASPEHGGKWMVSGGGGSQARWRRDGKELFYLSANRKLMAVDVNTGPTFQHGVPKPLFEPPIYFGATDVHRYDVTADGKRFVINPDAVGAGSVPIMVVLNWTAALKK